MTTIIAARGSRWENPSMHLAASTVVADIGPITPAGSRPSSANGIGFCCADRRRASAAPASSVPDFCGSSFRALYEGLPGFERALHEQARLENNILFPRVVSLATHAVLPR